MDLSLLPCEILSNIFKYLPLEDRKNVRLSNHEWNFACHHPEIIAHEKFVFRTGIEDDGDVSRLTLWLLNCRIPRSYFEFQVLPLMELTSDVWLHCGHKIESLFLLDCDVNNALMKDIILYCINLKHLRIVSSCIDHKTIRRPIERVYDDFGRSHVPFCSEKVLDKLIEEKVVRRGLITFELFIGYPIQNETFKKIFKIFPCIRNFGRGYDSTWNAAYYHHFEDNVSGTTKRSNMAREWPLPSMIENFTSIASDISESWIFPVLKYDRFKGFGTMINLQKIVDVNPIIQFFSEQTELEKLELFVWEGCHDKAKDLLLSLLQLNLPVLKELKFTSSCYDGDCKNLPFSFTMAEFSDFLMHTCNLETLMLFCSCGCVLDDDDQLPPLINELPKIEYIKLKKLELSSIGMIDTRISYKILNQCRSSLQSLCLKSVNNNVLQKIFEAHTELRTLHIAGLMCSELSFNCKEGNADNNGHSAYYSFQRLRHLQHLEIRNVSVYNIEASLAEFDFPELRCFSLSFKWLRDCFINDSMQQIKLIEEQCYGADVLRAVLNVLLTKSPRLEILRFCSSFLSAAELVPYCKKFRSLQFLGIDNMIVSKFQKRSGSDQALNSVFGPQLFDEDLDEVKNLFRECPSLQYVANFLFSGAYFYDRSSEDLKRYRHFGVFHHKYNPFFDF